MVSLGPTITILSSLKDLAGLLKGLLPGNSKYRRFFEKADVMFCIANTRGEFISLNQKFADELGYSRAELEGKKFMQFVHQEDRLHTIDQMNILREGGEVQGFVNRYVCRDGSIKKIEWIATGNGEIYAVARVVPNKS